MFFELILLLHLADLFAVSFVAFSFLAMTRPKVSRAEVKVFKKLRKSGLSFVKIAKITHRIEDQCGGTATTNCVLCGLCAIV